MSLSTELLLNKREMEMQRYLLNCTAKSYGDQKYKMNAIVRPGTHPLRLQFHDHAYSYLCMIPL